MFTNRIRRAVGDDLEGMTTVVHVPAIVAINFRGEVITRKSTGLVSILVPTRTSATSASFLLHPENQHLLSFQLHEQVMHQSDRGFPNPDGAIVGASPRMLKYVESMREQIELETQRNRKLREQMNGSEAADENGPRELPLLPDKPPELESLISSAHAQPDAPAASTVADNGTNAQPTFDAQPTSEAELQASIFDPATAQHDGIVLGIGVGSSRYRSTDGQVEDIYFARPGDDITVTFPTAGSPPTAVNWKFTVVDFYESKMRTMT